MLKWQQEQNIVFIGTEGGRANGVDPDQTPLNAASDQGLHCLLLGRGGGGGVTWGNCGTGVRASIYIWLWKNGPIHILDHPKCWPIHILPFDFCTHCWLLDKFRSQFVEYQENKQLRKISERKICAYTRMSEKWDLSHSNPEKSYHSYIFLLKKRGPIIYLAALKKGAIRHACPYYAIYPPFPTFTTPPPPPPPKKKKKKTHDWSSNFVQVNWNCRTWKVRIRVCGVCYLSCNFRHINR